MAVRLSSRGVGDCAPYIRASRSVGAREDRIRYRLKTQEISAVANAAVQTVAAATIELEKG